LDNVDVLWFKAKRNDPSGKKAIMFVQKRYALLSSLKQEADY
jgi:hypothetical protein